MPNMSGASVASVLQAERQNLDREIAELERKREGVEALLKDYGYSGSSNNARRTPKQTPSVKKGEMSNMEMVRQVLKSKHDEMNIKELRVAIQTKFRSDASKNLPQILHKAAGSKSSIYKDGRTGKYGLLEWKKKRAS